MDKSESRSRQLPTDVLRKIISFTSPDARTTASLLGTNKMMAKTVKERSYIPNISYYPADIIAQTSTYYVYGGDSPFKVILTEDTVSVFRRKRIRKNATDEELDRWLDSPYVVQVLKPTKYSKVYVGRNNHNSTVGSSVLVLLSDNVWLYIGEKLYVLNLNEDIIGYYSHGSGMFKSAYAVGKKHTYLINARVFIPNYLITQNDVYNQYYGFDDDGQTRKQGKSNRPDANKYPLQIKSLKEDTPSAPPRGATPVLKKPMQRKAPTNKTIDKTWS